MNYLKTMMNRLLVLDFKSSIVYGIWFLLVLHSSPITHLYLPCNCKFLLLFVAKLFWIGQG